jgi:hypothetical protein
MEELLLQELKGSSSRHAPLLQEDALISTLLLTQQRDHDLSQTSNATLREDRNITSLCMHSLLLILQSSGQMQTSLAFYKNLRSQQKTLRWGFSEVSLTPLSACLFLRVSFLCCLMLCYVM